MVILWTGLNDETVVQGETNFIAGHRDSMLETSFAELKTIQDPGITFQVKF